jgi:hypothetical protein
VSAGRGGLDCAEPSAWLALDPQHLDESAVSRTDRLPEQVFEQSAKKTLVIGVNINDMVPLDPDRQAQYTPPMALNAAYDALITMRPRRLRKPQPRPRGQVGAHPGWDGLALRNQARREVCQRQPADGR